jgi:hypothetical protein
VDLFSLLLTLTLGLILGCQLVIFALWARDYVARRQRHAVKLQKLRDSVPPLPSEPPKVSQEQLRHAYGAAVAATAIAHRLALELGATPST